jgi:restriction system protein
VVTLTLGTSKQMKKTVPKFDELIDPTLQALKRLGGSGSIDEIVLEIAKLLGLSQEVAEIPHGTSGRTELE